MHGRATVKLFLYRIQVFMNVYYSPQFTADNVNQILPKKIETVHHFEETRTQFFVCWLPGKVAPARLDTHGKIKKAVAVTPQRR